MDMQTLAMNTMAQVALVRITQRPHLASAAHRVIAKIAIDNRYFLRMFLFFYNYILLLLL